jgi:hypothetical protein
MLNNMDVALEFKIHYILTTKLNGLKWSHRTRSTSPFTAQSLCESSARQSNTRANLKPFHNWVQNSAKTCQLRANILGAEECCAEPCKDKILQLQFLLYFRVAIQFQICNLLSFTMIKKMHYHHKT